MPVVLSLTSFFFFFFFWVKTFYSVSWGSLERFTLPPSGQILGVYQSLRASLTSFNILLGTNFHLSRESGLSCFYTASLETPSVELSCTGLEAASPTEGLQGPKGSRDLSWSKLKALSCVFVQCLWLIGFSPLTLWYIWVRSWSAVSVPHLFRKHTDEVLRQLGKPGWRE